MPYETFWHLSPKKLESFWRAHELRKQEQSDEMWLMGQYVAVALDATVCNAMPFIKRKQKGKYPEKPIRVIPLTEEEKREEEEKVLQAFIGFSGAFESNVKSKNKKQGE